MHRILTPCMLEDILYTLPSLFLNTTRQHPNRPAFAFVGENPITYSQAQKEVELRQRYFLSNGIGKGDRIAILSSNSPQWGITFLAVTSMGAVAVPLLPDFSPTEISNVLNHSEARMLMVSDNLRFKLDEIVMPYVEVIGAIEDLKKISDHRTGSDYQEYTGDLLFHVEENDLASIIYTSGTTGKSKGVMLSHKNICFTAERSGWIQPICAEDRFLSVLPLAHTYENTIGFVLPMMSGAAIYYLNKPPTPTVLLPALEEVRPTIMLTVPLIIEKIFRGKVLPTFTDSSVLSKLYKIEWFRKKLHLLAGKKLMKTFGGELKFFGIGGAKLDQTVEQFLIDAKFPYAIGYGLTESAPLLAGFGPMKGRHQSTGPAMEGVTLKINNPDPITGEGEIWAKGPNVMLGYYKQPDITAEMITPDGWLKTGDLGKFDQSNYLFIKGRIKNVIIGPSGENIYPEEIESVINNFKHVVESIVVEKKGKLVAMVHFNIAEIEEKYKHLKGTASDYIDRILEELKRQILEYVNSRVNKFSKIQTVVVQQDPFQKTATQKIKRFLYTN